MPTSHENNYYLAFVKLERIRYTNSLVHKMRNVKRLHFNHTKAIAHRQSTIIHEFPVTCSFTLTVGYSLGMVKIEAFDNRKRFIIDCR